MFFFSVCVCVCVCVRVHLRGWTDLYNCGGLVYIIVVVNAFVCHCTSGSAFCVPKPERG